MELEINGQIYEFNFGMAFLRDINKDAETPIEQGSAIKQQIGLKYNISLLFDNDPTALVKILEVANRGNKPRLQAKDIDKYIDDPDTDLDDLFSKVLEGLEQANATRQTTKKVREAVEQALKQQAV